MSAAPQNVDRSALIADYCHRLWDDLPDGWVFSGFGRRPEVISPGKIRHQEWQEKSWRWPAQADEMVAHLAAEAALCDVYVTPGLSENPIRELKRRKSLGSRYLWVDLDSPGPDNLERARWLVKAGSFAVASGRGQGHRHAYVKLDEIQRPEVIAELNRRLVAWVGGDHSPSALNGYLRPPGSFNWKPTVLMPGSAPALVAVSTDTTGNGWAVSDIDDLLPPVVDARDGLGAVPDAEALPEPLPAVIRSILADTPDAELDRSERLFGLVRACRDAGLNEGQTLTAARKHRPSVAKYGRRLDEQVGHCLAKVRSGKPSSDRASASKGETPDAAEETPTLRRWTMAELFAEPDEFAWLIQGLWAASSFGMLAGEMKSLKSYLLGFIQIGVAAGVPIFGRFQPPEARPVLAYVGEGGRALYRRRMDRIAEAMGVGRPADLPIHPVFDTAPILSEVFAASLARDLREVEPALVVVDPYYAYHGGAVKASDLHAEATVLQALSRPCTQAGSALVVANHYNQSGSGSSLKRITMAGAGEWSDSWILVSHREDPDVDAGQFHLAIEVGSRQWGGTRWNLDLDIGHFHEEAGVHDGDVTWKLSRSSGSRGGDNREKAKTDTKVQEARFAITEILTDRPWSLTKTGLRDRVGGSRRAFDLALDTLVEDGLVTHDQRGVPESGTTKKRLVWGLDPNRDQLAAVRVDERWSEDAF